jgi:hypothetical protein
MNQNTSSSRPLDDIDVRLEETDGIAAADRRIEIATFTEGEYVESIMIDRMRALEIHRD